MALFRRPGYGRPQVHRYQTRLPAFAVAVLAATSCSETKKNSRSDNAHVDLSDPTTDSRLAETDRHSDIATSEASSILLENPISCNTRPKLTVLANQEWVKEAHGDNQRYLNFFTPVVHYKGATYWVWLDVNLVPYVSAFTDSSETRAVLAGGYKVRKDPHNIPFSLGIDSDGYIHVSGDMQNGPAIGSDREVPDSYRGARILYWRSKLPENVQGGFDFLGASNDGIPAEGVNGIRFFTDNFGVLYASAHVKAILASSDPGLRGVGLYQYHTNSRTWEAIGGEAPKASWEKGIAGQRFPVVFWDEGGVAPTNWFQGFFSPFRFDLKNRLHFASSVNTNTSLKYNDSLVYAVREDGQWKRLDGSNIPSLPIRAANASPAQGSLIRKDEGNSFNWMVNVIADKSGTPAVWAETAGDWNEHWFVGNKNNWEDNTSALKGRHPDAGFISPGGALLMTARSVPQIMCYPSFDQPAVEFDLDGYQYFINGDEYGLKTTGSLFGVAVNASAGKRALVRIDYTSPESLDNNVLEDAFGTEKRVRKTEVLREDKIEVLGEDKIEVLGEDKIEVLGEDKIEVLGEDKIEVLGEDKIEVLGEDKIEVLKEKIPYRP